MFADPAALRDLEAIVHPAVRPRILAAIAAADAAGAVAVVVEAIKLVEGGLPRPVRRGLAGDLRSRGAARRGSSVAGRPSGDADQRIAAQGDIVERLGRRATRTIDTSGGAAGERGAGVESALDAALGRRRELRTPVRFVRNLVD